jgi:hypothetical protein
LLRRRVGRPRPEHELLGIPKREFRLRGCDSKATTLPPSSVVAAVQSSAAVGRRRSRLHTCFVPDARDSFKRVENLPAVIEADGLRRGVHIREFELPGFERVVVAPRGTEVFEGLPRVAPPAPVCLSESVPCEVPAWLSFRYVNALSASRQTGPGGGSGVPITQTLEEEYVGLEEVDEGKWDEYFGNVRLGQMDERTYTIKDALGNRIRKRTV